MNVMRRMIFAAVMVFAVRAWGAELPDAVGEWRCVKEHVVPLVAEANGEQLGRIVYGDYERQAPRGSVQVIMTEGTGTGNLYVPEKVNDSDGVMPSSSGYRLLDIRGYKAILESHGGIAYALAVKAGEDLVITLESISLKEEALVDFAADFLRQY